VCTEEDKAPPSPPDNSLEEDDVVCIEHKAPPTVAPSTGSHC
jgi:hypothetical protein